MAHRTNRCFQRTTQTTREPYIWTFVCVLIMFWTTYDSCHTGLSASFSVSSNKAKIRPFFNNQANKLLVQATAKSQLNYCHLLYYNLQICIFDMSPVRASKILLLDFCLTSRDSVISPFCSGVFTVCPIISCASWNLDFFVSSIRHLELSDNWGYCLLYPSRPCLVPSNTSQQAELN